MKSRQRMGLRSRRRGFLGSRRYVLLPFAGALAVALFVVHPHAAPAAPQALPPPARLAQRLPFDPLAMPKPAMPKDMAAKAGATYSLFCGLWRTDGGFVSTIHIKNSLITAPLIVTPAVYTPGGDKLTLPPVTIAAGGEANVNINRALAALLPPGAAPNYGSAELSYMWSSPGHVVASVQMLDVGRSLIFTVPFQPPHVVQPVGVGDPIPDPGPAPHRIEMVWWRHDPGVHELLSLANTSDANLGVSYFLTGSSGAPLPVQAVALGPHQSQLTELSSQIAEIPGYLASSGGVTITYNGTMGQLLVAGLLENDAEGYSDHMPYGFHDPGGPVKAVRYAAPGILDGMPDPALGFRRSMRFFPYLILRNTSDASLDIHVTVCWPPEGSQDGTGAAPADVAGRYELPMLRFAPGGSAQVNMQSVLHAAGLDGFDGTLDLMVAFTGHEGDLITAAGSVDSSGSFVFATLPEAARRSFGRRESYWATGGGYDTMITLWNTGPAAEDIVIRLRYADGSGRYTLPVHLAPMASETVDLWQLIASGHADRQGRQFQMTERSGSMSFESAASHTTWLHLSADVAVYNAKNGTCGCYCDPCCAYTSFGIIPESLVVAVEGTQAVDPYGCYCNGQNDELDATLASNDTAVAGISGYDLNGAGPGQTTIGVTFAPVVMGGVNCYGAHDTSNCYSAPATLTPNPPATVTPTITAISPDAIMAGRSGDQLTISGAGFGSSPTVNLPSGFIGSGQSSTGSTVEITVSIAPSASLGDTTISVTAGGEQSNAYKFIVDYPDEMVVVSDDGGQAHCTGCATTIKRDVTYQVRTFADDAAGVVSAQEDLAVSGWNCAIPSSPNVTFSHCPTPTDQNGEFTDTWTMGSDDFSPAGCGFNSTDQWQWCDISPAKTFATLSGYVHTGQIEINGVVSPNKMPAGTVIKP